MIYTHIFKKYPCRCANVVDIEKAPGVHSFNIALYAYIFNNSSRKNVIFSDGYGGEVLALKLSTKSHTASRGEAETKRAGSHINTGSTLHIGVALQNAVQLTEVLELLMINEAALIIGVNHAGGAGGLIAGMDSPGAGFLHAGGQVGAQAQQVGIQDIRQKAGDVL